MSDVGGTDDRRARRRAARERRKSMPYVAGTRPAKAVVYLAAAMIGGGASITMLWIVPSSIDDVSTTGRFGVWIRDVGTQLPANYLVLLGFFVAYLVVWQLENALRDDRRDPTSASLRHRAAAGAIALMFIAPATLFLVVWIHLGVWTSIDTSANVSGQAVVSTFAAAFVVYLAVEVAAAPPPNALAQLPAASAALQRDERVAEVIARGGVSRPWAALAALGGLLLAVLAIPSVVAGVLTQILTGDSGAWAALAVAAASLATAFGVFCIASARVGLRGAGRGVAWMGWVYTWAAWLGVAAGCVIVWRLMDDAWWGVVAGGFLLVSVSIAVSNWPDRGDKDALTRVSRLLLAVRSRTIASSIVEQRSRVDELERIVAGASSQAESPSAAATA